MSALVLPNGPVRGTVQAPRSKSHEHRLLVAGFLAGDTSRLPDRDGDPADILATKSCLRALASGDPEPVLDCGESGSTLRFLAPVAAALGRRPVFRKAGRLADRPAIEYATLAPGLHELPGNVSSQFVTGLLFALPLLDGDSEIRFTSPLESRGYVDMTLRVLADAGIDIAALPGGGFAVRGGQRYRPRPDLPVEGDWSGAAFWLAMDALGSEVSVEGLDPESAQPDRAVARLLPDLPESVDMSPCPDLFPALAVVAGGLARPTRFTGIRRLRIKECDRVAAMAEALDRLGAAADVGDDELVIRGTGRPFRGASLRTFGDHRIAMAAAVAATRAEAPVTIDDADCSAKSYPGFFAEFLRVR